MTSPSISHHTLKSPFDKIGGLDIRDVKSLSLANSVVVEVEVAVAVVAVAIVVCTVGEDVTLCAVVDVDAVELFAAAAAAEVLLVVGVVVVVWVVAGTNISGPADPYCV